MRERWFGATGKRVPELAIEGDPLVPLAEALVLDDVSDDAKLREAHAAGTPVVVRAGSAEQIVAALIDRRLRPRRGPVGRRDAVEVPRRRLGRPLGRASRRSHRDPGLR
ncbi:MAG: hypothetical protein AUG43_05350 [Actinobacteria bacterium 13_1_20CM_3_68_10]|nr:MAG: hypothetical protein AUG43_05350 [Actinobacteria bacterium 13_1_20CM_3_68_10]